MEPAQLVIYDRAYINHYLRPRQGETKLGEKISLMDRFLPFEEALIKSQARFVLIGFPEDIGIRANYGRGGAHTAWDPFLQFFLNIQNNVWNQGEDILLLGHMDFTPWYDRMGNLDLHHASDLEHARRLVAELDLHIAPLIKTIVATGKIPVVIGGGHNNAYPILKGASQALGSAVNALNIDPHADLREKEGRHSGNGFRYAFEESCLGNYGVFGLHENYLSDAVFKFIQDNQSRIKYTTFEDVCIRQSKPPANALDELLNFIDVSAWGLEIDADGIQNFPASARTSSGWSANEIRRWVAQAASRKNLVYFHLCEAAPVLAHRKADIKTGKLLAYLVSDFLKAQKHSS